MSENRLQRNKNVALIFSMLIIIGTVYLSFLNMVVIMSLSRKSPFGYEPAGLQIIAPGTIYFVYF